MIIYHNRSEYRANRTLKWDGCKEEQLIRKIDGEVEKVWVT